jgi:hypothetical protein
MNRGVSLKWPMKENKNPPPALPTYVRFADIKEAGILSDYTTLQDYIARRGFPHPFRLSRKTVVWDLAAILKWIESQQAA